MDADRLARIKERKAREWSDWDADDPRRGVLLSRPERDELVALVEAQKQRIDALIELNRGAERAWHAANMEVARLRAERALSSCVCPRYWREHGHLSECPAAPNYKEGTE